MYVQLIDEVSLSCDIHNWLNSRKIKHGLINYHLSTWQNVRYLFATLQIRSDRPSYCCLPGSRLLFFTDYLFLCSGSSLRNKQMFNLICELPETVARTLVPRMRVVKGSGKAINYLTPPRILLALVTAWVRRGRWFDDEVHRFTYFILLNIHLDLALVQ